MIGIPIFQIGIQSAYENWTIFFHPFESINFQPAGFLAFKEKSGPLLHPYFNSFFKPFLLTTQKVQLSQKMGNKLM